MKTTRLVNRLSAAIFLLSCNLPAFTQTASDTFTLITCDRLWKTNTPVTGIVPGPPPPSGSLDPNYNGYCSRYKFSPPETVDGFCPFGYNTDSSHVNGVTVADLFLIQRHILGISPLQLYSPQWFASDANQSGTVTGFDLVIFRKLILGIYSVFPASYSWRSFSSYQIPNSPATCTYDYDPLLTTDTIDMTAVKIGDLDGDANPTGPYVVPQTLPSALLYTSDIAVDAGDTLLAPVFIAGSPKLHGMQAGFRLTNPALGRIVGIEAGLIPDLNANNIGLFQEGLNFAWFNYYTFDPLQTDTTPLFYLKIIADQSFQLKDALKLWHDVTSALWVDGNAGVHPFDHNLATSSLLQPAWPAGARVHAPAPNPFRERSVIRVDLESPEQVCLEVVDVAGRLLLRREQTLHAGTNTLEIPGEMAPAGGMMYYRVTMGGKSVAGKLLRL